MTAAHNSESQTDPTATLNDPSKPTSNKSVAYNRGNAYWVKGEVDPAIADYERALQLQPGRSAVRLRLADVLLKSQRHGEAAEHLERLRAEQPDNPAVLARLAQCLAALSRADEARTLLDRALAAHPEDFDALLQRAKLELAAGNFVAAEHEYETAAHIDPSEANLFDWASELLLHRTLDPAVGAVAVLRVAVAVLLLLPSIAWPNAAG